MEACGMADLTRIYYEERKKNWRKVDNVPTWPLMCGRSRLVVPGRSCSGPFSLRYLLGTYKICDLPLYWRVLCQLDTS